MGCCADNCQLKDEDEVVASPCSVCGRSVHHICSNGFYQGELDERFCSQACADRRHPPKPPKGLASNPSLAIATQRGVLDDTSAAASLSERVKIISTKTTGIPDNVLHHRRHGARDLVWDCIHDLDRVFETPKSSYRSICLLCVQKAMRLINPSTEAWKKGLCNIMHVSNGKKHLKRVHSEHSLAQEILLADEDRALKKIEQANQEIKRCTSGASRRGESPTKATAQASDPLTCDTNGSKDEGLNTKKSEEKTRLRGIEKMFRASDALIKASISKWLQDDGLPYTTVQTSAFKEMLCVIGGKTTLTPPARDTYDDLIDGRFKLFRNTLRELLVYQHERLYGMPFLTLIHDAWTCNRTTGIIGASVAFIDHQWNYRHIAVIATAKNDGHASLPVAKLIDDRCSQFYDIEIRGMARWTMSDTTASARNVAAYFDESLQEDCNMHILNLCINYGIGLKENVKTVRPVDAPTTVIKQVVTKGGPFPQGAEVIRKLRALNNFFCTPKRMEQLRKIQEVHNLPILAPLVDVDVRVASTCRLMRRSIVNYCAMKMLFIGSRDSNVFSAITRDEWTLICEMEAITQQLSRLALSETQSQSMVASYMLVYRTMAEAHLKSRAYPCLVLGKTMMTACDDNLPREEVLVEKFTEGGKICINRCLAQVRDRFPELSRYEGVTLLLDPRTKNCAADIIDGIGTQNAHRDNILQQAKDLIIDEYIRIYKQQHASRPSGDQAMSPVPSPPSCFDKINPPPPNTIMLFGAPVPKKTKKGFHESRLKEEAELVFQRWMDHQEDWVKVALDQGVDGDHDSLSKDMCWRRDEDTVCWNIIELSRVNVLKWFREVGEPMFPTIATLARVWLGKACSTAFQERVFSTAGIVMSARRSQTDNFRAEKQLLLRVNRGEIPC